MDWHPEHHGEWRSRWPRLSRAVEWIALTVLVLTVVLAVALTVGVAMLFPWGMVR